MVALVFGSGTAGRKIMVPATVSSSPGLRAYVLVELDVAVEVAVGPADGQHKNIGVVNVLHRAYDRRGLMFDLADIVADGNSKVEARDARLVGFQRFAHGLSRLTSVSHLRECDFQIGHRLAMKEYLHGEIVHQCGRHDVFTGGL